ncbi:hypothetical protein CapIbe_014185 [Capra ibex]
MPALLPSVGPPRARPGQARDGETWKTAAHVLRKKGLSRDPVPSSPFAGLGAPITVGQPGVQVGDRVHRKGFL